MCLNTPVRDALILVAFVRKQSSNFGQNNTPLSSSLIHYISHSGTLFSHEIVKSVHLSFTNEVSE